MVRVSEGKYRIGDTKVLIFVRVSIRLLYSTHFCMRQQMDSNVPIQSNGHFNEPRCLLRYHRNRSPPVCGASIALGPKNWLTPCQSEWRHIPHSICLLACWLSEEAQSFLVHQGICPSRRRVACLVRCNCETNGLCNCSMTGFKRLVSPCRFCALTWWCV